jgi:hypothetical protein
MQKLPEARAQRQACEAADRGEHDCLTQEQGQYLRLPRTQGAQQADLVGALVHRDGHDGDDTDGADEQ